MTNDDIMNIDDETIKEHGLQLQDHSAQLPFSSEARVFKYPGLDGVYLMEGDLYGNRMPKGSCFLAFEGQHGFIGKHLMVESLKNLTAAEIKNIVVHNRNG